MKQIGISLKFSDTTPGEIHTIVVDALQNAGFAHCDGNCWISETATEASATLTIYELGKELKSDITYITEAKIMRISAMTDVSKMLAG